MHHYFTSEGKGGKMRKVERILFSLVVFVVVIGLVGVNSYAQGIDTLRVGVASMPGNLDPSTGIGLSNTQLYFNIYDLILYEDPFEGFNRISYICDSWEMVDDYTAEFRLREGVTFHNGAPLTSEDIQYTIERIMHGEPGYVGSTIKAIVANVTGVEIIDDLTFRVLSSVPDNVLMSRLGSTLGIYVVPKAYIEEVGNDAFGQNPIGTGPYMVESFTPERLVLTRYEGYYGEAPIAERIEYILYQEASTRVAALLVGEVDIILQLPPDMFSVIENESGVSVGSENVTIFHMLRFNAQEEPMSDKLFRQALSLGIDRQLLCDAFWFGTSVVPNGYNFPEYADYYVEDYPYYQYDPDVARKLVEQSIYNGEEIKYELRPGYYEYANEVAEAIVSMWKGIGVNARVVYNENLGGSNYQHVANWSNGIRFPDPVGGLWLLWGADTIFLDYAWQQMPQEFIDAGRTLESSMDFDERYEANETLMRIWDEEVPGTIIYRVAEAWAVKDDIPLLGRPSNRVVSFRAEHLNYDLNIGD